MRAIERHRTQSKRKGATDIVLFLTLGVGGLLLATKILAAIGWALAGPA